MLLLVDYSQNRKLKNGRNEMNISEIITRAIEQINSSTQLPFETRAMTAFDSACDPIPIDKFYVVFNGRESDSALFENENKECCQKTHTVINMNCYSGADGPNEQLNTLAVTLSDMLMSYFDGMMTGYSIGSCYVEDSLNVFCLPCRLMFGFEQCPASVTENSVIKPFADFMCKTHVKDSNSHLSQAEKAYLDEPYVTGSYTGLGYGNHQVISLGFYPKIVIVFAVNTAVLSLSGENPLCFFGVAVRGHATKGIAVQSGGFKVAQAASFSSNGVYPKLNELNVSYAYIAFR